MADEQVDTPEVKGEEKAPEVKEEEKAPEVKDEKKENDEKPDVHEETKDKKVDEKKEEVKAVIKKWKLKFGDKEEEVEEDELVRRAQKAWGIEKKAEKASADRKLAETFFDLAKSGDFSWLDKLSTEDNKVEAKKLVSEWLVQQALKEDEEKRLTPEQKELRAAKAKLAEYQKTEENKAKTEREAQIKVNADKYTKEMQVEYQTAAKELDLVPENEVVQALTAQYLEKAIKEKINVGPKDVMPIVKKHIEALDKARFDSYDGEKLVKWLGKNIEKIRKADLNAIKGIKPSKDEKHTPRLKKNKAKEENKDNKDKGVNHFKQYIKEGRAKWDEA